MTPEKEKITDRTDVAKATSSNRRQQIKEEMWNNPVVRAVLTQFADDSFYRGRLKSEVSDSIKQLKEEINEDIDLAIEKTEEWKEKIKEEVWEKLNDKYGGCGHYFEDTKESGSDWTKMACASCPETIESLLDRTIDLAMEKTAKAILYEGRIREGHGGKFKDFLDWIEKKWVTKK